MREERVHIALAKELYDGIVREGVDARLLNQGLQWDPAKLPVFDGWLPFSRIEELLELGCRLTGNPSLHLRLAESGDPQNMGVVGRIIMNCESLRQAACQWERYGELACSAGSAHHEEGAGRFRYVFNYPGEVSHRLVEHTVVSTLNFCRRFTGRDIIPIDVRFRHQPQPYKKEYERIFRCPVLFSQRENTLALRRSDADVPPSRRDRYLQALLTRHADSLINGSLQGHGLRDEVGEAIRRGLPQGDTDIRTVSRGMNMSRWTLNRRLKAEGTSFRSLLEETRKSLALSYLRSRDRSSSEVAFLLGFSEPSAFNRAFKRWVGTSPGEYRKSKTAAPLA